jgi:predicted transcriptional regulator
MSLSNETSVLGFLARKAVPQRLTAIYEGLKASGISRSTLYRNLQQLVDDGVIAKENDGYFLVEKGKSSIKAADLARLNEMNPIFMENKRGLRIRAYGGNDLKEVNWQGLRDSVRKATAETLIQIDPTLTGILEGKPLSRKAIEKLVGLKFAMIVSFDGTDFTTLSADDIKEKRKDAMKLLATEKRLRLDRIAEELHLNPLEVRQLLHPLLQSELVEIDDEGFVSYTLEVTPE